MSIFNKFYYYTWNIGFIEKPIENIISSKETFYEVKWIKHPYNDRFFADPFILEITEENIKILVEEFVYHQKKGVISLLTLDKKYELIKHQVLCEQPYHQSYPAITKVGDSIFITPEASQSGSLFRYNLGDSCLINQEEIINKPLLDSTFLYYQNRWWLFATKRGNNSNKDLFVYFSNDFKGPFFPHKQQPVKSDLSSSRPGGNIIILGSNLYRVAQVNTHSYGEAIRIYRIDELTDSSFNESFIKEIHLKDSIYNKGFHTLNSVGNICVVDGLKKEFRPLSRILFEVKNKLK